MKYNLINAQTKEVVYQSDEKVKFGGEWSSSDEEGNPRFVWIDAPEPPLETFKEQKREEMKEARDRAESEPLAFKNTKLDFDQISRERLMFAIIAKEPVAWTDYNNEVIELSAKDLEDLPALIKERTQSVHARYNELKALIEDAETKEEIEKIEWAGKAHSSRSRKTKT